MALLASLFFFLVVCIVNPFSALDISVTEHWVFLVQLIQVLLDREEDAAGSPVGTERSEEDV